MCNGEYFLIPALVFFWRFTCQGYEHFHSNDDNFYMVSTSGGPELFQSTKAEFWSIYYSHQQNMNKKKMIVWVKKAYMRWLDGVIQRKWGWPPSKSQNWEDWQSKSSRTHPGGSRSESNGLIKNLKKIGNQGVAKRLMFLGELPKQIFGKSWDFGPTHPCLNRFQCPR